MVLAWRRPDQPDPDEWSVEQVEGALHVECPLLRQGGLALGFLEVR